MYCDPYKNYQPVCLPSLKVLTIKNCYGEINYNCNLFNYGFYFNAKKVLKSVIFKNLTCAYETCVLILKYKAHLCNIFLLRLPTNLPHYKQPCYLLRAKFDSQPCKRKSKECLPCKFPLTHSK